MNCVICAIAKQENQYIYEWAKHHLQIGFSHIHIYDNNEIDGENIADVFKGTDIETYVTIHDVRGKICMQLKVYQECYDKEDFEWCAFVDIDEFITFTNSQMTISQFLSDKANFEAVHLNWLCYGDDEKILLDGKSIKECILHPILPLSFTSQCILIPENTHVKSIIRKGVNIVWDAPGIVVEWANPHTPSNLNIICDELGQQIINSPWKRISHNKCYVAHYITKTISEYGVKVQRRAADNNNLYHSYTRFFCYNKLSLRKILALKRMTPSVKIISMLKELIKYKFILSQSIVCALSKKYKRKLQEEKTILEKIDL